MKKMLVLVFALIMAFTIASCKKKPSNLIPMPQAPQVPQIPLVEPEWDDAEENLIDWIKEGTYTYTYVAEMNVYGATVIHEGTVFEDKGSVAINSSNKLPSISGESFGVHAILKDNSLYILNDTKKTYVHSKSEEDSLSDVTDFGEMKYIGNGEDFLDGDLLPYREYNITDGTSRFYMDGSEVRAIDVKTKGITMLMIITEASNKIPKGALDVPEDYVESEDIFDIDEQDMKIEIDYKDYESLIGI